MTVHNDTPRLTSAERDFVERLAEHYSPPPMTAAERVAFDEALHSHVVRRRTWMFTPLTVAATAAALGMWLVVQNGTAPDLTGQDETRLQTLRETAGQHETVGEVLLVLGFDEPNGQDGDEGLPKEYAAISTMLNDG